MKLIDKNLCTACGACSSICPKECISITQDKDGFYYPEIKDDNCIDCGLCMKQCPINCDYYKNFMNSSTDAYVLKHKDIDILRESTSGGAFTAILQAFKNDNTVFYGAVMGEDFITRQERIESFDNVNLLRKSKYVESFSGSIYKSVKRDLLDGMKVVYSGTPCQIAGLKAYLSNENHDNLLTVDIICHGVPTNKLLTKYIEDKELKSNSKINKIEFRSKIGSNWLNPKIRLEFEDGQVYSQKSFANDDEYMIAFCKFLCLRENCECCRFAQAKRCSDITIGDFWGIEDSNIDIAFSEGISLLLLNSNKGKMLLDEICKYADVRSIDYNFAIKYNPQLSSPALFDKRREDFLTDLNNCSFSVVKKKYLKPRNRIIRFLSNVLNRELKDKIKILFGKKPSKY